MNKLPKYRVVGDPSNPKAFSSHRIISSLNQGAQNMGVYDENGLIVVYDTLCNSHGYEADAFICCYELSLPKIILQNAKNKPVIGVSRDNLFFLNTGYPKELLNYFLLGVNVDEYPVVTKQYLKDKFVFGVYSESLVRGCYEVILQAFGKCFSGNRDVVLYLKDRNGTRVFREYVETMAKHYNIEVLYNDCHLDSPEKERAVFEHFDVSVYLNRSTTFGMCVMQSLSMGLPTISLSYSGPRDYISDGFSGLTPDYDVHPVTQIRLGQLEALGMRNFFFPVSTDMHPVPPVWAEPRLESVEDKLLSAYKDAELRKTLASNGRLIAERYTWDKSALNLSYALSRFFV